MYYGKRQNTKEFLRLAMSASRNFTVPRNPDERHSAHYREPPERSDALQHQTQIHCMEPWVLIVSNRCARERTKPFMVQKMGAKRLSQTFNSSVQQTRAVSEV